VIKHYNFQGKYGNLDINEGMNLHICKLISVYATTMPEMLSFESESALKRQLG
jgi:hypothetical protein